MLQAPQSDAWTVITEVTRQDVPLARLIRLKVPQ
jgi:hypothetical protein